MRPRPTQRVTIAALALSAALTTGFAPALGTDPQPEGASSSQAGRCLEGYAYVTVLGTPYGRTTTWCIRSTDCQGYVSAGPAVAGQGPVRAYYYVSVPQHTGSDVGCYL